MSGSVSCMRQPQIKSIVKPRPLRPLSNRPLSCSIATLQIVIRLLHNLFLAYHTSARDFMQHTRPAQTRFDSLTSAPLSWILHQEKLGLRWLRQAQPAQAQTAIRLDAPAREHRSESSSWLSRRAAGAVHDRERRCSNADRERSSCTSLLLWLLMRGCAMPLARAMVASARLLSPR